MMKEPSPIELAKLDGFEFFVKRDDLLGDYLGGNKARKLEFFVQNAHKFEPNLRLISYGSSQSNALAALSVFAKQKGFSLVFVCEKISHFLKENPCGNYAFALKNGAQIIENTEFATRKEKALSLLNEKDIFIEEGIACDKAQWGFETLAKEIEAQSRAMGFEFDIFLPAGTGASALYVAKYSSMRVFTCACVGDEQYLKQQMLELEPNFCVQILGADDFLGANSAQKLTPNLAHFFVRNSSYAVAQNSARFFQKAKNSLAKATNLFLNAKNSFFNEINSLSKAQKQIFETAQSKAQKYTFKTAHSFTKAQNSPKIFILKTPRKFHFAKPYKELLNMHQRALQETGIEFSLLYDSVGLLTMLANRDIFTRKVLYIHQGGARGNESMLMRYAYKGF